VLDLEKHYRPLEVEELTGLSLATIRKRILRREIAFRRAGRAILIPQSEVEKMIGPLHPAIRANGHGSNGGAP
jgi:excisionase family DNA binding protein